jgi:endonuclease G, mitochondrial
MLIDAALNPQSRHPSTLKESTPFRKTEEKSIDLHERNSDLEQEDIKSDGTVTWKVPIEVSIRLGTIIQPATGQQTSGPVTNLKDIAARAEAVQIDPNYRNRSGYNPSFLTGYTFSLPALNNVQRPQVAQKQNLSQGEDPYELKYEHFSIVMNAKRRMAFFTAVNVDGSKWIDINRRTGEPRELAEAAEVWSQDPRVEASAQSDQSLYSSQQPERVFDRGHLVRRADPSWGTTIDAKKANADTFHFTNCTPQHHVFNENVRYWAGIENYVLENAKAEHERVTVFTGPVFAKDDPDYSYAKVPKQFWKILVRIDNGDLLATALLADQSELITQLPEGLFKSFGDLSKIAEYQSSVKEI